MLSNEEKLRRSWGYAQIVDDGGHRKSGNFTDGVGRQYIGEIGKVDNGIGLSRLCGENVFLDTKCRAITIQKP